jgi:hypothetical protein
MPAAAVAMRTPSMAGRCGRCFGAKGEIVPTAAQATPSGLARGIPWLIALPRLIVRP